MKLFKSPAAKSRKSSTENKSWNRSMLMIRCNLPGVGEEDIDGGVAVGTRESHIDKEACNMWHVEGQ